MDWGVYLINNCPIANKTKFLVVFEFEDGVKGFLINSRHHKLLRQRHLKACVATVSVSTNPFLSHDSYIDCTKLISLEAYHLYSRQGFVCEQTKYNVINAVLACTVLEQKLKIYLLDTYSGYLPS